MSLFLAFDFHLCMAHFDNYYAALFCFTCHISKEIRHFSDNSVSGQLREDYNYHST